MKKRGISLSYDYPLQRSKIAYRTDINGLRAWAVMAVVLFHFQVPGFTGGFVGVDVFFVISGFLMTTIISRAMEQSRFRLWDFYLDRAKRIFPALIVVVVVLLFWGWFFLLPEEYRHLGKHSRDSLLFSSNLRYLSESGYFDSSSLEKWLLHTWSLSVEWQFYLAYPLILIIFYKFLHKKRILKPSLILLVLSLSSFTWCQFLTWKAPDEAFFLLSSRAWELLIGGLIYLTCTHRISSNTKLLCYYTGLVLIIVSTTFINKSTPWPGFFALLPVTGTALILLSENSQSTFTQHSVAQWLGTRSYSIYLWHWPAVVMLVYFDLFHGSKWKLLAITCSIAIGHFSYTLIEKTSQNWLKTQNKTKGAVVLISCIAVTAACSQLIRKNDFTFRLPSEVSQLEAEGLNRNPRDKECTTPNSECIFGGKKIKAIVIGDSHAIALVTSIREALPSTEDGVLLKAAHGCLIVFEANNKSKRFDANCSALKNILNKRLHDLHPGIPIILINRLSYYAIGSLPHEIHDQPGNPRVYFSHKTNSPTDNFLEEFSTHYVDSICLMTKSHPVYLLNPIPEMEVSVPQKMAKGILTGKTTEVSLSLDNYHKRQAFSLAVQDQAALTCGAKILDPTPYLCSKQTCYGSINGKPLYYDDDHLSETGNKLLTPLFKTVFKQEESLTGRSNPLDP